MQSEHSSYFVCVLCFFIYFCMYYFNGKIESLAKPRRRWQRERLPTKDLLRRTIAVYTCVVYFLFFVVLSAKQQHEATKVCASCRGTRTKTANFFLFQFGTDRCDRIFRAGSSGIFRNKNIFRNIFRLFCSWELNSRNGNPGIPE